MALERGDIRKAMFFMPPRHGKSLLVSERFSAWYLGRNPSNKVIGCTYGQNLSDRFSRHVRDTMKGPDHLGVFDVSVSKTTKAMGMWETTQGGEFLSTSTGGAMTGFGFHLGLLDDPIKGREVAYSPLQREGIWDWYLSDFNTRQQKDAAQILVQTRWHDDDLAGRILNGPNAKDWYIVSYPALDKEGKALWPDMFDADMLTREFKNQMPSYEWEALYQQNPVPDEGGFFKDRWFRYYEHLPAQMTVYGASDYATKDGEGDWTVHIIFGVDRHGNVFLLDLWREQTSTKAWIDAVVALARRYHVTAWGEEAGQIINSVGPFLTDRMKAEHLYFHREQFASSQDKQVRAQTARGMIEMGRVYFPKHASWLEEFKKELTRFPASTNDDQVDALSIMGRMLLMFHKPMEPDKPTPKPALVTGNVEGYRPMTFDEMTRGRSHKPLRR